jgi:hypothetical protein
MDALYPSYRLLLCCLLLPGSCDPDPCTATGGVCADFGPDNGIACIYSSTTVCAGKTEDPVCLDESATCLLLVKLGVYGCMK